MSQAENNRANREGYKAGKQGKDSSLGQRLSDMGNRPKESARRAGVREGRADRKGK